LHRHAAANLYELGLSFETRLVADEESRRELAALWPIGSIPVLRDETADLVVPESTTIIEYLDGLTPDGSRLIPRVPRRCRRGCGIASTTSTSRHRCRRSSATSCVLTEAEIPWA